MYLRAVLELIISYVRFRRTSVVSVRAPKERIVEMGQIEQTLEKVPNAIA